jgi:hypothetical protein
LLLLQIHSLSKRLSSRKDTLLYDAMIEREKEKCKFAKVASILIMTIATHTHTQPPPALLVIPKVESLSPTPGPTKLESSTKGPTNSPVFVAVTQRPTTLRPTTLRPTTLRPTAAPVTIEETTQSPTAAPVAKTLAPGALTVTQSPTQPTLACLLEDVVDKPFFVSVRLGLRDYAWLAENSVFQIVLCNDGQEANDLCRATCNNCGPTAAPVTAPAAATRGPTLPPSPAPVAVATTRAPTNAPISAPTNAPITAPTLSLTVTVELRVDRDLILTRSPASAGALDDDASSQSQALAWLESDSTAETLTEERLVQRWVMATLACCAAVGSIR